MTSLPTARRLSNSLLATPRTHSSLECAASASGGRHQSDCLTSLTHGRSDLPDGGHQGRPLGRRQHRSQPRQASATTKSGPDQVQAHMGARGQIAQESPDCRPRRQVLRVCSPRDLPGPHPVDADRERTVDSDRTPTHAFVQHQHRAPSERRHAPPRWVASRCASLFFLITACLGVIATSITNGIAQTRRHTPHIRYAAKDFDERWRILTTEGPLRYLTVCVNLFHPRGKTAQTYGALR